MNVQNDSFLNFPLPCITRLTHLDAWRRYATHRLVHNRKNPLPASRGLRAWDEKPVFATVNYVESAGATVPRWPSSLSYSATCISSFQRGLALIGFS